MLGEGGSPTFSPGTDAGHTQPFTTGKGVFGKDAEIRTHQALHDAKPSECPKGDRDNKSEVYFKNRLFLQTKTPLKRAGSQTVDKPTHRKNADKSSDTK